VGDDVVTQLLLYFEMHSRKTPYRSASRIQPFREKKSRNVGIVKACNKNSKLCRPCIDTDAELKQHLPNATPIQRDIVHNINDLLCKIHSLIDVLKNDTVDDKCILPPIPEVGEESDGDLFSSNTPSTDSHSAAHANPFDAWLEDNLELDDICMLCMSDLKSQVHK
jgi:hypothetical protein